MNKNFTLSLILFIMALVVTYYVIFSWFGLVCIVITVIHLYTSKGIKKGGKIAGTFLFNSSMELDKLWCFLLQVPMNLLFCSFTDKYYLYGHPNETVSSATGKNLRIGNKNKLVKLFATIIDFFLGKNHCIDYIDDSVDNML